MPRMKLLETGLRRAGRCLALASIAVAGSACSSEPGEVHQSIEATVRGGGRDISARFDFTCRPVMDQGVPLRLSNADSILFVKPDREALLMTSPFPRDDSLCIDEARRGGPPEKTLVPILVWIDDIRSPSRVDVFGTGTVASHRKFAFPELTAFSHRSQESPPSPSGPANGRAVPLRGAFDTLESGAPGASPRLIAAARRAAKVDPRGEDERAAFEKLLGPRVAPGVRLLSVCGLMATADGSDYLSREAPRLIRSCPKPAASALPGSRIRFAVPLPMKFEGDGRWLGGGADAAMSYLRDDRSGIELVPSNPPRRMARASPFWRDKVRSVTWITLGERRVTLPVAKPSAYYIEEEGSLVLFLDDAEILYLNNPAHWTPIRAAD